MINKKYLIDYFFEGTKLKNQLKIGVEHEKFVLNKDTLQPLTYEGEGGILDIFKSLIDLGWSPIIEGEKEKIIALKRGYEFITLEPGGQLELSGAQLSSIHQTCTETTNHLNEIKSLSNKFNFILLGIGVEPKLILEDFPWMPKDRYSIMKKYMPKVGDLGHHMMKRSCTSQINFDYFSEKDMIKKFRILLNFESIGTAIFANSPFDKGRPSKYKSLRSHFWHHTDKERTGITPFVFSHDFNFESYADYALNVPMYFIKRNNKYIDMTSLSFKDFLNNKSNSAGDKFEPSINDWSDHISTLFPQVRLKQYLEVRSIDACSWKVICAPPAFWTGILYDNESMNEAYELTQDWTDEERLFLNLQVPEHGLNTRFRGQTILQIANKLLEISEQGLKRRNILSSDKKYNEMHYLSGVKENLSKGMSPADLLMEKYHGIWKNSLESLYEEEIF